MGSNNPVQNSLRRRSIIKAFALAGAWSQIAGSRWFGRFLLEVRADTFYPAGTLSLRLSDFPALQSANGSVYVDVSGIPTIIITRASGGQFYALTSVCTHMNCTVGLFDPAAGLMTCPCHGSEYAMDGSVVLGPAEKPLLRYDTHFDGANTLRVDLVKIGFQIQVASVKPTTDSSRLSISFDSLSGVRYQLLYKATLAATAWKVVSFSKTLTDPVGSTLVIGTGSALTIYVDVNPSAPSGFYLVEHA